MSNTVVAAERRSAIIRSLKKGHPATSADVTSHLHQLSKQAVTLALNKLVELGCLKKIKLEKATKHFDKFAFELILSHNDAIRKSERYAADLVKKHNQAAAQRAKLAADRKEVREKETLIAQDLCDAKELKSGGKVLDYGNGRKVFMLADGRRKLSNDCIGSVKTATGTGFSSIAQSEVSL